MSRKFDKAVKVLSKEQYFVIAAVREEEGKYECSCELSTANDVVGEALYNVLIHCDEIRPFLLGVVRSYLSRYEIEQRNFIESLK